MTADEIVKQVEAEKANEADKVSKPKASRNRKKVNLDAELAKKHGTFAVGIQATIRELMKLKK